MASVDFFFFLILLQELLDLLFSRGLELNEDDDEDGEEDGSGGLSSWETSGQLNTRLAIRQDTCITTSCCQLCISSSSSSSSSLIFPLPLSSPLSYSSSSLSLSPSFSLSTSSSYCSSCCLSRYMHFSTVLNGHLRSPDFEAHLVERFAASAPQCPFVGKFAVCYAFILAFGPEEGEAGSASASASPLSPGLADKFRSMAGSMDPLALHTVAKGAYTRRFGDSDGSSGSSCSPEMKELLGQVFLAVGKRTGRLLREEPVGGWLGGCSLGS